MTQEPVSLDELIAAREALITIIVHDRVIASCQLNGRRVGDLLRDAGGREGGN